jgi:hypothetical protein
MAALVSPGSLNPEIEAARKAQGDTLKNRLGAADAGFRVSVLEAGANLTGSCPTIVLVAAFEEKPPPAK